MKTEKEINEALNTTRRLIIELSDMISNNSYSFYNSSGSDSFYNSSGSDIHSDLDVLQGKEIALMFCLGLITDL